jgi:hypothetical protein
MLAVRLNSVLLRRNPAQCDTIGKALMDTHGLEPYVEQRVNANRGKSGKRRLSIRNTCLLCFSVFVISIVDRPVLGQSTQTLRIYLARHGETDWNVEHRLQGCTDTALNATGRQQAARLAERLKGIHLDAIYSSTLTRSRDTAEIARGQVPLKS